MQAVAIGSWTYQTSFQIIDGNQAGLFGISKNQNTGIGDTNCLTHQKTDVI